MTSTVGTIDRKRCGGTRWAKVDDHYWDRFTQGHVVPWPLESSWCISPTRTPVSVQAGSLESILCYCANYGQTMRIQNLLAHRYLDEDDIHPAARADAYLHLQDRHNLARVLLQSAEARSYVTSLNPLHIRGDAIDWAVNYCSGIEDRLATSGPVEGSVEDAQQYLQQFMRGNASKRLGGAE